VYYATDGLHITLDSKEAISMSTTATDRIEKRILLRSPRLARVARRSRLEEFGAWFRTAFTEPFGLAPGPRVGSPTRLRAPGGGNPDRADGAGAPLLVSVAPQRRRPRPGLFERVHDAGEFTLEDAEGGTAAHRGGVGIRRIPIARRAAALKGNDQGWSEQLTAIEEYLRGIREAGWLLALASGTSGPGSALAALGDPTRLELVARLCNGGPQSIARLTDGLNLTRQAITKHLRVLAESGLVRALAPSREPLELEPRRLESHAATWT